VRGITSTKLVRASESVSWQERAQGLGHGVILDQ